MEPELWVVVAAIALPFVGALLTPVLHRIVGDRVGYVGALVAAASFGLVGTQVGAEGTVAFSWIPSLDVAVRLQVDGLAVLFALLASGIGVLVFTYSTSYMHGKPNLARFYLTLLAFMGSILGVAFAADIVLLFLFWELTSVCSFVLIGYHTADEEAQYSARMAMIITVGGGLCLLIGLLLLSVAADAIGTGSFDLAALVTNPDAVQTALREQGLFLPALVLITIAAAAKSAQVPLYFWLPRAMVAPTPVSAFLHSATMVKVGVYALGRVRPVFHSSEWLVLVATLGLVTMAVGAVLAVRATDIKELLAYSTASHLGLLVAAFGFRVHYGAEAGAFHLLNHAVFKAALFLVAGIVAHEVGTRRIDELGGLRTELPFTAGITVVAALSMAGIPPFHGFYSKEILFEAAWETATMLGGLAWLYPVVAVLASIFTVLYSLRFLWLFFGEQPDTVEEVHRPSIGLLTPPAVLAVVGLIVSVRPELAIDVIVQDAASAASVGEVEVHAGIPTHLSGPVVMSLLTIGCGIAAFPRYERLSDSLETIHQRSTGLHPTTLYDGGLSGVRRSSQRVGALIHSGLLRTYVFWVLLATSTLALSGYLAASVGLPTPLAVQTPLAMAVVLGVAVVAAVAVTTSDNHLIGVLTLGILGFMIAIFFILASGPDLALTQLVVETLLLLIFLLVLEELPTFSSDLDLDVAVRDGALSLVVGATAFLSVLVTMPTDGELTTTATTYVEQAVDRGGGSNVVNVILTDFRAFDTLGESIVIVLAGISVFVLLTMRNRGEPE